MASLVRAQEDQDWHTVAGDGFVIEGYCVAVSEVTKWHDARFLPSYVCHVKPLQDRPVKQRLKRILDT